MKIYIIIILVVEMPTTKKKKKRRRRRKKNTTGARRGVWRIIITMLHACSIINNYFSVVVYVLGTGTGINACTQPPDKIGNNYVKCESATRRRKGKGAGVVTWY